MITIYINGCSCGPTGQMVRKIQRHGRTTGEEVMVKNTRYDKQALEEHSKAIKLIGVSDSLTPVVVETIKNEELDATTLTVTRLSEWDK